MKLEEVKETLFCLKLSPTPGDADVDKDVALRNNLLFMPEILLRTNENYKSDRSALLFQIIICIRTLRRRLQRQGLEDGGVELRGRDINLTVSALWLPRSVLLWEQADERLGVNLS